MQTPKRQHNFYNFSGFPISKAFYYCLIAGALLIGSTAHAFDMRLAWDHNEDPTVAGYRIYYGTASGDYTTSIDVGDCESFVLKGLSPGQTYYIALTAYDSYGNESGYSNEVEYRVPPSPAPWLTLLLAEDAGGGAQ